MKNIPRKTADGYIACCVVGGCPEIKFVNDRVFIRNSQKPEVVVEFSEQEYAELKSAIANKIF